MRSCANGSCAPSLCCSSWRRCWCCGASLPLARIGAGYAAEQTCACLFVSGRTLESCRGDLDPLALKIVSLHVGSDDVRASVAGLMPARAQFSTATGCALVQ